METSSSFTPVAAGSELIGIELNIRRAILSAQIGETRTLPIGDMSMTEVTRRAKEFARSKGKPIVTIEDPSGFCFKRISEAQAKSPSFPEMDHLEIGQSHLYEVAQHMHQRVRMAASLRNRQGQVFLSCRREGQFIRVIRQPLTPDECAAHAGAPQAPRESKYGLERLQTLRELTFNVDDHKELRNLRVAVSTWALNNNWRLTCRKQPDGTTKVVRLDHTGSGHE